MITRYLVTGYKFDNRFQRVVASAQICNVGLPDDKRTKVLLQSYVIIASISPATERQWARSEHMLTDDQCRWKTMKQMAMLPLASTNDMFNLLACYLHRIDRNRQW